MIYAGFMPSTFTDIWKSLSSDDRLRAAEAFWSDAGMRSQQQSTLQLMSKRYNFRLKSLQALPATRKAKMLLESSPTADVVVALLAAFHLTHRKDMLIAFLDAAAIPHKDGVLAEEAEHTNPDPDKIKSAVETIRAKFPSHDVDVYLEILYLQDPQYWSALKPFIPERATT
jgi:hypothetical protein